jgi:excisionase family DNA binding protein
LDKQSHKRFLTIREAAELLNVHENTIRNLITRGNLKAERIGKGIIRIRQAEIEALFTPYIAGEFGVWAK